MCTVTVVSFQGKTIITSNRDEQVVRPSAIEPQWYSINSKRLLFPKDQKAGGTWYAVAQDGSVLVLLNGAAEKHQIKPSYRKSRGLVVVELMSSESLLELWHTIDLMEIEPFTLVYFKENQLYQLRWNETAKETILLDPSEPHIWSSSTLYTNEVRQQRANWFASFLHQTKAVTPDALLHFHRYTQKENQEHGLVINRKEFLKTLSITQTIIESNKIVLSYFDLQKEKAYNHSFITI